MNQLGDLEKILSAAKEIGENFQKELTNLREENELLKIEVDELRDENKILRDENEKIYLEMNSLRKTKEDIKVANEAFASNLNQLVEHLEDSHKRNMEQINQVLNGGLQKFVADYMQKFQPLEGENPADINSAEVSKKVSLKKFQNARDDVIIDGDDVMVEDVETALIINDGAKKNKMQYAAFYAEEAEVEKDDAGSPIKMKNLAKPRR